jgi:xanthine dehydrogenase YagS FAD-binding subunit
MLPNFSYIRPASLAEALDHLAAPGARAHAGGTDLLGCLRDRVFDARLVVSLGGLAELRGISTARDGSLRIGALTRIADVAAHPEIAGQYSALAHAADAVASPQIRHQGTIGGNLCQRPRCWYFRGDFDCARKGGDVCYAMAGENQRHALFGAGACLAVHPSDTATALVALRARASIAGRRGARSVDLESFFVLPDEDMAKENVLQPDEILTEIVVPSPPAGFVSAFRKVRTRGAFDFALASLAVGLAIRQGRVEAPRIVLGAAALKPWRAVEAEQALAGARLNAKTIALAANAAVRNATPLEENAYKIPMFRGLVLEVRREGGATAGPGSARSRCRS